MEINRTSLSGDIPRSSLGPPRILREQTIADSPTEAIRDVVVKSEQEGIFSPDMASIKKSRASGQTSGLNKTNDSAYFPESKPFPSQRYLTVGEAYKQHAGNRPQILDHGTFVKFLPPDLKPPCHQLFIIRMDSGPEVKVAHNSDVADTLPNSVKPGDKLELKGEYIYEPNGGVVHWTHHADGGSHEPGYILVEKTGQKYD
ncbi:MAG: DUF3465 domain-containing protein [bacterium]